MGQKAIAPVAVVIPCYNSAKTLLRAVESVAQQSVLPKKVVLVDDCSSDQTIQLMHEIQNRFKSINIELVFNKTNLGAGSARNLGWSRCTEQDYICFLDSDDSWASQKIEIQYQFMKNNPSVVLSGHDYEYLTEIPQKNDLIKLNYEVSNLPFNFVLLKNPFITPSIMVKVNSEIKFLQHSTHMEDHLFIIETANRYKTVRKIMLPLAYIYKPIYGSSGLSSQLIKMEFGNQKNLNYLLDKKIINNRLKFILSIISYIKLLKRIIIITVRKISIFSPKMFMLNTYK